MRERAGLLNLVAELRGRLDELENLVRTAPNHSIISPVSYDDEGVVDLTPADYKTFRAKGLAEARLAWAYEPFPAFLQFGAPDAATTVEVSSPELSDLHRTGPEPGFAVRMVPQGTVSQAWFTYELLLPIENATDYVWLEWVMKLSLDQPVQSFIQFLIEGDGYSEPADVGISAISDFATFKHVRLDRSTLLQASAGRAVKRIRLTFSTGGMPLPFTLYAFSIFGRV